MSAEFRILGVRHHGPGSARAVGAALDELDPSAVVIEGPPELDAVAPLAADPEMRPPVAALVYVPDEPRRASFYPMAVFSPEWVALRWALAHDRPVRFADLPGANALARGAKTATADDEDAGEVEEAEELDDPQTRLRTDPLAELAAAAGFDDPERWWEDAVELRHRGLDAFDAVLEAITEVRAATGEAASDLVREAAMRRVLRTAETDGHESVAVVCGAWHGPALVREGWPSATADRARLQGLPKVKTAATWVPWTSRRLAAHSGYGAGVTSPGWYHHLFTQPDEPVTRWLVRTARLLRDEQLDTSSASVIEAQRLAETLAVLRGRPLPGLAEVWEATQAVLCGGSAVPMRLVADRLLVGDDLGQVPDDTPMVPLARDLAATQKRLRLKPSPTVSQLDLDLRTASHLARSVLFHRLLLLGIDWAVETETGRTTGTFRESWLLEWRPELSVAVIEASGAGTTVEAAAADTVTRRAADADIADLCELVESALLAELPGPLAAVMAALDERAALQHDILRLMAAVEPLARVRRYGNVRGADTAAVGGVLAGIVTRVAIGLPPAAAGLDDDAAAVLRARIDAVQRGVAVLDEPALRSQWLDSLATMTNREDVHGLLRGRATRILLDAGRLEGDEATRRLSLVLSRAAEPAKGAAFLEGFLAGDALLLLHDHALLAAIDGWLTSVPDEAFDALLPLLRRSFSGYEATERRMIGDHLRRLDRGEAGARAAAAEDLDEERAARVQPLLRLLLGLDGTDG